MRLDSEREMSGRPELVFPNLLPTFFFLKLPLYFKMVFICVLWKRYMNRHEGILGEAEEGINGVTGGFELPSVGTRNPIPVLSICKSSIGSFTG